MSVQLQLASFIQKQDGIQRITGFTKGTNIVVLFENMYFYCTYLTKTKILSMLGTGYFLIIGPLQLAIRVVQNRRAGEQKSHCRDKINKENYHLKFCMSFVCLALATFALQHGGFVPREWLAARKTNLS